MMNFIIVFVAIAAAIGLAAFLSVAYLMYKQDKLEAKYREENDRINNL